MSVATDSSPPATSPASFLHYCGQIVSRKGYDQLLAWFLQYNDRHPSPLRLERTGSRRASTTSTSPRLGA